MITLSLGISLWLMGASGEGVGPLLLFAMLFDAGVLTMFACRGEK